MFLPNRKDRSPLTVVVHDGRWTSIGDPNSLRHRALHQVLLGQGGINVSVPSGLYHYNVKRRFFRNIATLTLVRY